MKRFFWIFLFFSFLANAQESGIPQTTYYAELFFDFSVPMQEATKYEGAIAGNNPVYIEFKNDMTLDKIKFQLSDLPKSCYSEPVKVSLNKAESYSDEFNDIKEVPGFLNGNQIMAIKVSESEISCIILWKNNNYLSGGSIIDYFGNCDSLKEIYAKKCSNKY
ncbi:MAG: hypothetical protein QE271_00415 [Bacteriovoracaceae bacterium]|nr:hypothetical protein [Bacteriovoracaceae bacterium]